MSDVKNGIADVLVEMMRVTGDTPSQLARRVEKPASTVNRYIMADGTPKDTKTTMSAATLAALTEATCVSVTFAGGRVFVTPKSDREFAKNADEISILRGWRALGPADQADFKRMLRRFLPPDQADNILPAA